MIFLINSSNLKKGGGLQVADSVCCLLERFPEHYFIVITIWEGCFFRRVSKKAESAWGINGIWSFSLES